MGRVVFLLEEPSMKALLEGLLPRLFPDSIPNQHFLCIDHEGKADLEQSIPRKLRGWRVPGDVFIIVRDNDGGDCIALKERLRNLCKGTGHDDALVRIVCQELEAWYLGQPDALADVYDDEKLRGLGGKSRYRNPDAVIKPSIVLEKRCPRFQKQSAARQMGERLTREGNRSPSFRVFVDGIARLIDSSIPELSQEN